MEELDFSYEEIQIRKELFNNSYIYKDKNENIFNDKGKLVNQPKFETALEKNSKQQQESITRKKKEKAKERKEKKEEVTEMSSSQFAQNIYNFQMEIFDLMLEKFKGKVVGSGDFNRLVLENEFFEGFKPGEKDAKKEKKVKKPRPLTGYTYFGKTNKDKFNKEMEKMDEKPKFVAFLSKEWKKLSKEEQQEWDTKAKNAFKEENPSEE